MFEPTPEALELLKKRYFWPGEDWPGMCRRVAQALADTPIEEKKFYSMMVNGIFLPNTPCLVNAGRQTNYSACFIVPIEDDLNNIFETLKSAAAIFKTGGGVGINFSTLRQENAPLKSGGISSGPISFMKIFDTMIEQVKSGGVRRGAMMSLLSIDHPDIVKFIKCKDKDGVLSNMNISILMTDEFMNKNMETPDALWMCHFGDYGYAICKETDNPILCTDNYPGSFYTVRDIYNLICKHAWKNGEPGLVFIDEAKRKNGNKIIGVNPCGEVVGEPWDACVLGSIDVAKLNKEWSFPIDDSVVPLKDIVETAILFLNKVVDKGVFPLSQITEQVKRTRKIGLGIMGFADYLILREIRYGSIESFDEAEDLMKNIQAVAREYSDENKFNNTAVTCIAPTGSLSMIAGCSSGIEPVYRFVTKHNRKDFGEQIIVNRYAKKYIDSNIPLPQYFVEAHDVTPSEHIQMQATFQKNIDLSISKTINLHHNATQKEVEQAYYDAWVGHCKGITVYRDGSRQGQVLSDATKQDPSKPVIETPETKLSTERPYCLPGKTYKLKINLGGKVQNVYINVTSCQDGNPHEVFLFGNVRELDPGNADAVDVVTRLISLCLRGGIPVNKVIAQLEKVPCGNIYSLPHKIAHVLKEHTKIEEESNPLCPECGNQLAFIEKCITCKSCGWSKCT